MMCLSDVFFKSLSWGFNGYFPPGNAGSKNVYYFFQYCSTLHFFLHSFSGIWTSQLLPATADSLNFFSFLKILFFISVVLFYSLMEIFDVFSIASFNECVDAYFCSHMFLISERSFWNSVIVTFNRIFLSSLQKLMIVLETFPPPSCYSF